MKAFATTIMAVLFVATVSANTRVWETKEQEDLDYVLQGGRGFYQGFQMGLYKIEKVDDSCLSKEAETKIIELFGMIINRKLDMNKIMSLVGDFMIISSSIQSCKADAFKDLFTHCMKNGENTCTPDKLVENVQKNLFLIMGKMTDVSTLATKGIPKNSNDAFEFGKTLGKDIGSVMRIVLGFHQ